MRPKPLDLNTTPVSAPKGARKLNLPEQPAPQATPARALDLPTQAIPASPRQPARLSVDETPAPPPRRENPKTKTDLLLEKAAQLEPTLQSHRLRGRVDFVLNMSLTDLLDWGNRNLAPLQQTSAQKAKIASELSRIDPSGWLERTKDASCKPPSVFDRFTAKPPSYYESMLNKTRAELLLFVQELEQMKKSFFGEITDLHLDAMALIVCGPEFADDQMQMAAQNRAKTLLSSHQTAAVLQHTIEQTLMMCANYIQQIDSLLSVTIPQWKVANEGT